VKTAIKEELSKLKIAKSKAQVGLITFESDVKILGDCSSNPITLRSDLFNDYD